METWDEYVASTALNQSKAKKVLISDWEYLNYRHNSEDDDDVMYDKNDSLIYGKFFEDYFNSLTIDTEKYYVVKPESFKFPSDALTDVARKYVEIVDAPDEFTRKLRAMEGYDGRTKDPVKRVAAFDKGCTDILRFWDNYGEDVLIIPEERTLLAESHVHTAHADSHVSYMYVSESEAVTIYKSLKLEIDGWKMEADIVSVLHDTKTIHIADLKTCGNSVKNFIANIVKYRYDFQMAWYYLMIVKWAAEKYPDYTVDMRPQFVVASSMSDQPPAIYNIDLRKQGLVDYYYGTRFMGSVQTALDKIAAIDETSTDLEVFDVSKLMGVS